MAVAVVVVVLAVAATAATKKMRGDGAPMRPVSRHVLAQQLANEIARSGAAACQGKSQ